MKNLALSEIQRIAKFVQVGKPQRLTIERMQEIAKKHGGKCLSKKYIRARSKLKWQCNKGHIWMARPDSVKGGSWCPYCAKTVKRTTKMFKAIAKATISELQTIAEARGGRCISKRYIDSRTNLEWQCAKGHTWEARANKLKSGSWCPVCAVDKLRLSIEEMQKIAAKRGGKCLSEQYVNSRTKLKWQCSEGHIWKTAPANVKGGSWCPYCAKTVKRTLKEMKELARARGGKCLSKKYINGKTKLRWQCAQGHIWEAAPYNVRKGGWCPSCSVSRSERVCRKFFEVIFNKKFPNKRPKWLIGPKGTRMELDGYCEDLRLAFEYQGAQHYKNVSAFTMRRQEETEEYDELKKLLCKKQNVALIEVPYSVQYDNMAEFIIKRSSEKNVSIPKLTKKIDYKLFNIYSREELKELNEIAKSRGGKCLSSKYLGAHINHKWQCSAGHVWEAQPSNVKHGNWCPICYHKERGKKQRLGIQKMQDLAKSRGGECLSTEYINVKTRLKWKCSKGHVWESAADNIMQGKWCPMCGCARSARARSLTIEEMQKIAKDRDGKCLSKIYKNSHTKLKWQCIWGHEWEATPSHVKYGTWCPVCARSGRKIRKLRKI